MRKLTTLCLTLLIGLASALAVVPQRANPSAPSLKMRSGGAAAPKSLIRHGNVRSTLPTMNSSIVRMPGKKGMLRAGASGSTVYGWLGYTENYASGYGLCEVFTNNGTYSAPAFNSDLAISAGFIRNGNLWVYGSMEVWGMIYGNSLMEYDIQTGNMVNSIELSVADNSQMVITAAYDPASDNIYGFCYTADGSGYQYFSAPASDPTKFKYAPASDVCSSLTWNVIDSKLIGVTHNGGNLVEIDPATGAMTTIMKCPIKIDYISGLCYSPIDNAYIWNPNSNTSAALYKISMPGYTFTKICDYPDYEEFMFLVSPDTRAVDPKAPAAPEIANVVLGTEEPNAIFFYNIPDKTFDGTAITGNVKYRAEIDGKYYHDGTVAAGTKNWVFNYVVDEPGIHTCSLTLLLDDKESVAASRSLYIGNDTPLAPKNVVLTKTGVSWDAVTAGVHDGVVDTDALTYTVSVDGKEVATGVKGTSIEYTIPEGELALHRASVVAVCNGFTSAPGVSEGMIAGNPLSLPVSIEPTEDQFALCTIVDNNKDSRTFFLSQDEQYNSAFVYVYSNQQQADDWVILPAMNFPDAEAYYSVSLLAGSSNPDFAEKFEIYLGTTPDVAGMTKCVLESTDAAPATYDKYRTLFNVPSAGTYYIGIRCVSPADGYYLYMRNINVEKTDILATSPAAPTALTAQAGAKGALKATVSFTMPLNSVAGTALDASAVLTATVKSPVATATVTGKPGEQVQTEVATEQGTNRIEVSVSDASGSGDIAAVNVMTGVDIPGIPNNFVMTASEDDLTLHLTWEAPSEEGMNGGYCAPTGITYYLCSYDDGWSLDGPIGTDVYSYDIELGADSRQTLYRYGIVAENAAGICDYLASASCVAGKPYEMPFAEQFTTDGGYIYGPITVMQPDNSYNMSWSIVDPSVLGNQFATPLGGALVGYSEDDNSAMGYIAACKISTEGSKNAKLALNYFYGLGGTIEVLVAGYGDEAPVSLGNTRILETSDLTTGYNEVLFDIPAAYQNRDWVQIFVRAYVGSGNEAVIIPSFGIREQFDQDLEVSLDLPGAISLDRKSTVKAIVKNVGSEAAALRAGRWTLTTNDGRMLVTEETPAGETLQPGEKVTLTFSFTAEVDYGQRPKVEFALATPDDNAANDKAQGVIWVSTGEDPVVLDLCGTDSGDDYIDLSWTEPSIGKYVASFENEEVADSQVEDGSGDGIPPLLDEFSNIDGDDAQVYGIEGLPYFVKAAFNVWSVKKMNSMLGQEIFSPYAGDHFLVAFSPLMNPVTQEAPVADDWLISPAVEGGSKVKFGICAISWQYEETVEVLYSTTDDSMESFEHLDTFTTSSGLWETVEVTLPEDAKYFAIRYISQDKYAVLIDGIEYQGEVSESNKVVAYDIIRDGNTIAPAAKAAGYYRDATITDRDATYAYNIVPILGNGTKGRQSNTVYIQASGVNEITGLSTLVYTSANEIHAVGFEGEQLSIYTVDGTMLYSRIASARECFTVAPGVYILQTGNTTHKILVK